MMPISRELAYLLLIFTLMLANILRERFAIDGALYGGPLTYAGLATLWLSRPVDVDLLPNDVGPTTIASTAFTERD